MGTKQESDKQPSWIRRLAGVYRDAGISVIPLRLDGSKAPAIESWAPYQQRLATDDELDQCFGTRERGIGMVAGAVSGGLEILDFDDGSLLEPWWKLVKPIVNRLPIVSTPSNGWHVLYRCDEICGNSKIAKDPKQGDKPTLIETRGEGGYVVAEGSPSSTHKAGLPYCHAWGPFLPNIPRITPVERTELWAAARTFDKRPGERDRILRSKLRQFTTENREVHPLVADFSRQMTWQQILEPHGWRTVDGRVWTRPGDKRPGTKSAQLHVAKDGSEVLTVWSGNAGILAPESGDKSTWGKFWAWSALNFRGDGKAAFARLREGVV